MIGKLISESCFSSLWRPNWVWRWVLIVKVFRYVSRSTLKKMLLLTAKRTIVEQSAGLQHLGTVTFIFFLWTYNLSEQTVLVQNYLDESFRKKISTNYFTIPILKWQPNCTELASVSNTRKLPIQLRPSEDCSHIIIFFARCVGTINSFHLFG